VLLPWQPNLGTWNVHDSIDKVLLRAIKTKGVASPPRQIPGSDCNMQSVVVLHVSTWCHFPPNSMSINYWDTWYDIAGCMGVGVHSKALTLGSGCLSGRENLERKM